MYPIDVPYLVHRETIGSRASDPTLPDRPSRRARLRRRAFIPVRKLRLGSARGGDQAARSGHVALID